MRSGRVLITPSVIRKPPSLLLPHSFVFSLPSNLSLFSPQNPTFTSLFFSFFLVLRIMARVFRSKSCRSREIEASPPSNDEEEEEGQNYEDFPNPISSSFLASSEENGERRERRRRKNPHHHQQQQQFPILAILVTALRKSLVTCSVERGDDMCSIDIGWPTEVRHVSHVTFDRFNGFLGLPVEFEPDLPRRVPSARCFRSFLCFFFFSFFGNFYLIFAASCLFECFVLILGIGRGKERSSAN